MSENKCMGCYLFVLFVSVLFCLICICVNISYFDYEEEICNITHIDYPTTLPTFNNESGWVECDCGKYCTAFTPCIKMYSDLNPEVMVQNDFGDSEECTIYEKECKDGEDIRYSINKFNEVSNIVSKYYNQETECYYIGDKKEIYLNNTIDYVLIICSSVLLGLMVICGLFCYCCQNKKNSNKVMEVYSV